MLMVKNKAKFYKKEYAPSLQFVALWVQGETSELVKSWNQDGGIRTRYIHFTKRAWCRHAESASFACGWNKNVDPWWLHPHINKRTRLSGVKDGRFYLNCQSLSKNLS